MEKDQEKCLGSKMLVSMQDAALAQSCFSPFIQTVPKMAS